MKRYKMEDGSIIDTEKAQQKWEGVRYHDGCNLISRNTGSQWHDPDLFLSRKGRYYLLNTSCVQGQGDHAEFITDEEAASWLLINDHELPESLKQYEEQVIE